MALGATLFLLGLLSGFVVPMMTNPRMGLAGHLEGVMNGIFVMAVGAIWSRVSLPRTLLRGTSALLIYGTYTNWIFVSLAAIFGTSDTTPLAGAGHVGLRWQENLVTFGLITVGVSMVAGCGLLAWGLFRREEAL